MVRARIATLALAALTALPTPAADPDAWAPVRPLLGRWEGTSTGKPGSGMVTRSYEFVLGERFIRETHVSRYPPNEKKPQGEVHEHVGMISHDRAAKTLVLRQFHIEGFVNTYRQASNSAEPGKLVFDSEAFENLGAAWKARETYELRGGDEFTETFELAPPGKPFEVYSTTRFKRVPVAAAAPAAPCDSPAHRQFDFWIGEWNVHAKDKLAGTNRIEREYGGCVLHERYDTARGYKGESLNAYDPGRKAWHQTWVDNSGTLLLLEGGLKDKSMVLEGQTTGADGRVTKHRITWTPNADGSVRQHWESTDAQGQWATAFDGRYTKK